MAAASWDSVIFDVGQQSLVRVPTLEPLRGSKAHVQELLDRCADREGAGRRTARPLSRLPVTDSDRTGTGDFRHVRPHPDTLCLLRSVPPSIGGRTRGGRHGHSVKAGSPAPPSSARRSRKSATRTPADVAERHEKLTDDVDAILDDIDEVLETNPEDFVRSFVQKGGQ